ncbi:hypothetical protein GCM10027456_32210 [Kineosporia babensis]
MRPSAARSATPITRPSTAICGRAARNTTGWGRRSFTRQVSPWPRLVTLQSAPAVRPDATVPFDGLGSADAAPPGTAIKATVTASASQNVLNVPTTAAPT